MILTSMWRGAQAAGWEVTQPRLHSQESGVSEHLFSFASAWAAGPAPAQLLPPGSVLVLGLWGLLSQTFPHLFSPYALGSQQCYGDK